tara:strand:+ start:265 stop:423 length:159 start_codon:yes stop_codon:yes gene_type:complete
MTSNFYEFMGMATFVSTATFFVVGLRWFIFKLGTVFSDENKSTILASERKKQ